MSPQLLPGTFTSCAAAGARGHGTRYCPTLGRRKGGSDSLQRPLQLSWLLKRELKLCYFKFKIKAAS